MGSIRERSFMSFEELLPFLGRKQRHKGRTQGRGELGVQSDLRACEELGEVMGQEDGGDQ